jgi:hypothetical protein
MIVRVLCFSEGTVHPELSLGLGSVHPNCRVSHYGFMNNDANEAWGNTNWTAHSPSNKRDADEAINLSFRFDSLARYASTCVI